MRSHVTELVTCKLKFELQVQLFCLAPLPRPPHGPHHNARQPRPRLPSPRVTTTRPPSPPTTTTTTVTRQPRRRRRRLPPRPHGHRYHNVPPPPPRSTNDNHDVTTTTTTPSLRDHHHLYTTRGWVYRGRAYVYARFFYLFTYYPLQNALVVRHLTTTSPSHETRDEVSGTSPSSSLARDLPRHHPPSHETRDGGVHHGTWGGRTLYARSHFCIFFYIILTDYPFQDNEEGTHPPRHLPRHHCPPSHETRDGGVHHGTEGGRTLYARSHFCIFIIIKLTDYPLGLLVIYHATTTLPRAKRETERSTTSPPPSLARNARRRGMFSNHPPFQPHHPLPRSKRETEGDVFQPHHHPSSLET